MNPYIMQSVLLLVAPALFAASIYMELGRIVLMVDGERALFIRRTWLTKIFVAGDVLSFLMQSSGKPTFGLYGGFFNADAICRCWSSCHCRLPRLFRHGRKHHRRWSYRPSCCLRPLRDRGSDLSHSYPQPPYSEVLSHAMGETHGLAVYRQHSHLRPIHCESCRICPGQRWIHHIARALPLHLRRACHVAGYDHHELDPS